MPCAARVCEAGEVVDRVRTRIVQGWSRRKTFATRTPWDVLLRGAFCSWRLAVVQEESVAE
jgi:hypothetical protein